ALLEETLDRVTASGTPEFVLVSGGSGIGKSALVGELHKALVPAHGFFASGKFEPSKRESPYASLAQAFRTLVHQILSRSEAEISLWRGAFREALGANGQIVVDLVPELELVIGRPMPLPALSPQEAQNLFHVVFRRFVAVFARADHPLVLFLDDLQWVDAPTLALLEEVIGAADAGHLLLIGAYRDGEVSSSHPLAAALGRLREAGAAMHDYALAPLAPDDVNRLVAETLHCDRQAARPLSALLYEKTDGNPFFAIQFFTELAEEGLVVFAPAASAWQWDLARIRAKGFTDNVVDLMVVKLSRLPDETRAVLSQLACLGDSAPAPILARIRGSTEEEVHAELWDAVGAGLVGRQDDVYAFLHDRIKETAYSLIPRSELAAIHLQIGRRLLAGRAAAELGEEIFAIVGQYNHALALVTSASERVRLAELYLLAGKRAKGAAAYGAASTYLAVGTSLLPERPLEDHDDLAFALEFHRAESEFLSGAVAAAETRLAALAGRVRNLVDRAAVTCLSMSLHLTQDRPDRAIEACLDYLARVGICWSPRPTDEDVKREFDVMWRQIGSRPIEALAEVPLMTDPERRATMDVLTAGQPAAAFTDENLHGLLVARLANFSLEHGTIDGSCIAYVWLGMILGPRFGDYRAGYRLAKLGIDLIESRGLRRYQARAYLGFGHIVSPWTQPLRNSCELVRRAFEVAAETGDLTYASFSRYALITLLLDAGEPLGAVEREAEQALIFLNRAKFGLTIDMLKPLLQLVRALRGLTTSLHCFDDDGFDEGAHERRLADDRHLAIAACWYWIRKLQLRILAGDYPSAREAAAKAEQLLWTSPWFHERAVYHFYAALAHAADGDAAAVSAHHRQLERWAETGSGNFESFALLAAAELARLEDRDIEAMRLYEQAAEAARANGLVHNAALAHELAARFYRQRDFATIAEVYERKARELYDRWGALGKVQALDLLHPHQR
ncbi:MAG: AAA family ATPase, partial [Alphaproteobacteria bacterium]|nr:AAA family ATPase [Alphaproteobacteria bacterium]